MVLSNRIDHSTITGIIISTIISGSTNPTNAHPPTLTISNRSWNITHVNH
jgi:hypothetical protein